MSHRLVKLLPLAAALALGGIASASIPKDLPSVVVKYDDRTLDSRAGVANLHARIRNAAGQVCSPLNSRVLGLREEYERCVADAVAQSVAAVGNQNLHQYHLYGKKSVLVAAR